MGPYGVGTKSFVLQDCDRKMLRGAKAQRWVIQAFYPMDEKEDHPSFYMPGTIDNGLLCGKTIHAHGQPEGALSQQGPFPVLIFIPGFGEIRQRYTILCEELASQGYVVLSLDQPYTSSFVGFPDGSTIVPTLYDLWKTQRDRDYRYAYFDESMTQSIADIRFIIDHIDTLNEEHFAKKLDGHTIILMGHSFGGNVAHTLGFQDKRIAAVVDIDSKITERKIFGHRGVPSNERGVPVLFIRASLQYQEDVGDQLEKIKNSYVKKFAVHHSCFQDTAYLIHHVPGLGQESTFDKLWLWFFKSAPIFDSIDTDLNGQNPDAWFKEIRHEIVSWLTTKVKA